MAPDVLPPPPAQGGGAQGAQAAGRDRYKLDTAFLGKHKDKTMFTVDSQYMTEEDYYILRTYLKSGGGHGTITEIENYLFALMDNHTMNDYNHYKAVQQTKGVEVTTADEVIDTFGKTVTARRPLTRLRCDFLKESLHSGNSGIFSKCGEKVNSAIKQLTLRFQSCRFHEMRAEDILLYSIIFGIEHDSLRDKCFDLWSEKCAESKNMEVDNLVTLILGWFESYNESMGFKTSKTNPKTEGSVNLAQG